MRSRYAFDVELIGFISALQECVFVCLSMCVHAHICENMHTLG